MGKENKRYVKTFPLSWEQVHRDTKALAWQLAERGPWQGIIAITRGGLVPASIIARELAIHHIDTVCISSYNWKEQGQAHIIKPCTSTTDGSGWLVIDDLVDTGGTLKRLREQLPKAYFATVYAKPKGRPLVDSFVTEFSQDTWALFPWDTQPQFVEPIATLRESGDA